MTKKKRSYAENRWHYDVKTWKIIKKWITEDLSRRKAVTYVRVSDEKQVTQWYGMEGQYSTIKEFCNSRERDIERCFEDEAISWWELQRKWLMDAIKYIEEQNKTYTKIHYFVVTELSRISRSDDLWATYATHQRIEATWCKVIATMNPVSSNDESWEMIQDMNYIFAKYERRKIKTRTKNGMRARILEWNRPFPQPVWYTKIKEKIWIKFVSTIIKEEPQASIIKEWLEMFANGVFVNQTQLLNYFNEKKLRSNSHASNPWKLYIDFVNRLFEIEKLMFYTGHVLYPDYDVNEPILWKREPLISISTAHKILDRLERKWSNKYGPRKDTSDKYPLRWLLYCPECDIPFTASPSKGKLWKYYDYYLINSTKAPKELRRSVSVEKVHEEFRELLRRLTPKPEIALLLRAVFESVVGQKGKLFNNVLAQKRARIKEIERKIEVVQSKFYMLTNQILIKKMEQEWWELEQEKDLLTEDIKKEHLTQSEFDSIYNDFISIIENPLSVWDLQSTDVKQLLIGVLFGGKIYYTKKGSFQTPQKSLIYSILDHISGDNNPVGHMTIDLSNPIYSIMQDIQYEMQVNADKISCIVSLIWNNKELSPISRYKHLQA